MVLARYFLSQFAPLLMNLRGFLLCLLTFTLFSFPGNTTAQVAPEDIGGFELSSRVITFGTGVITSGLDMRWTYQKEQPGNWFALQGNSERAYFVRTYPVTSWMTISGNVGQFSGVPWSGVRLNLYPIDNLTVWLWHEWSAGTQESGFEMSPEFFARSVVAFYTPGPFSLSAALVDFKPVDYIIKQVGVKYTHSINNKTGLIFGTQYEITQEEFFFQFGLVRTF